MRRLSMLPMWFLLALLCGGCSQSRSTESETEPIAGTSYQGFLNEADLMSSVRVIDAASTLTVVFRQEENLLAQVLFEGEIEIFFGGWKSVEGPERMEVTNLVVQGNSITGSVAFQGVVLNFEAVLNEAHTVLDLLVSLLGSMTLRRVEPEETPIQ